MARTLKAVSNVIPSEITISLADKDLQDYLVKISSGDIKSEILGLIKIGLMCVTRANTNNEIDFWEKKSQELQMNLLRKTEEVINKDFLQAIKKQLGVKDGQLLAPIANQVETTSRFIDKALTSNETRIKAVVSEFNSSLTDGTLVESFSKILIKELSPLIAELRSINYHVIEQKGEENIKGSTTLKGKEYEQHILEQVQTWARYNKFKVENVGMDNRPGDIVVESLSEKIKIAIEVKDISTPKGHSVLTREMGQVIQERKATTAIFLCKTINGLAKEIGSYGEGVSDNIKWVATTGESLEVALNHCLVQERLRLANEKNLSITNAKKIKENIELAKTLMRDMSQHYRSITEIQKAATTLESSLRNTNAEVLRALSAANDLITCK
jgi:hypothetical protein